MFVKKGAVMGRATYGIRPHRGGSRLEDRLYFETSRGLKLTHTENGASQTIAFVGFEIENAALQIQQLQGQKGSSELLRPLRWEHLLVSAIVELAKVATECQEVHIPRAASLTFYSFPMGLSVSRKEFEKSMRLRYDTTAKRLGFKWCSWRCAYYRDIRTDA
ncbi:MAG: hypothetical protein ACYCZ0_02575 [Minisyncoccota bacterium]